MSRCRICGHIFDSTVRASWMTVADIQGLVAQGHSVHQATKLLSDQMTKDVEMDLERISKEFEDHYILVHKVRPPFAEIKDK